MSDPYLQAIHAIPVGETRTFLELALAAGRPGGARTASKVVNAAARTDTGPWHRVVYSSGGLSHDEARAKIQWRRLQHAQLWHKFLRSSQRPQRVHVRNLSQLRFEGMKPLNSLRQFLPPS